MAKARRKKPPEEDPAESEALEEMAQFLAENGDADRLPEAEYQRRRTRLQELQRMGSPSWALEVYTTEFRKEEQT